LFKQSNLNIAFRATNTIQQLTEKQTNKHPSGIYKISDHIYSPSVRSLQIWKIACNTCNNIYVGQPGGSINIRHKEYVRYIRTNNPSSAYALHILQNRYEYGTTAGTLQLLKKRQKNTRMNYCEALYIQIFHQHNLLITEQQVNDSNPLYELANTTRILPRSPQPVSRHTAQYAHRQPVSNWHPTTHTQHTVSTTQKTPYDSHTTHGKHNSDWHRTTHTQHTVSTIQTDTVRLTHNTR
jgi:hypothetical protein